MINIDKDTIVHQRKRHHEQSNYVQEQQTNYILLWILFMMDGLSLALPSTSLLYMINTHVIMPIHLLPSYYAISFLPNQCKPIFAIWTNYLIKKYYNYYGYNNKSNNNSQNHHHHHISQSTISYYKYLLLSFVLLGQSICTIGTCSVLWIIPNHHNIIIIIISCYIWSFLRNLFDAWSEYIVQILLLDHITHHNHNPKQQQSQQQQEQNEPEFAAASESSSSSSSKQQLAAVYQSQSSTARSVGCVVAYCVNALCFYYFIYDSSSNESSSNTTTTISPYVQQQKEEKQHSTLYFVSVLLFIITSFINLISAIIAYYCSTIERKRFNANSNNNDDSHDDHDSSNIHVRQQNQLCPINDKKNQSHHSAKLGSNNDNDDNNHLRTYSASDPLLQSYHGSNNHYDDRYSDPIAFNHHDQQEVQVEMNNIIKEQQPETIRNPNKSNHNYKLGIRFIILMQIYLVLLIIQQPATLLMKISKLQQYWIKLIWWIIYIIPTLYLIYLIYPIVIKRINSCCNRPIWYERLFINHQDNNNVHNSDNDDDDDDDDDDNDDTTQSDISSSFQWYPAYNIGIFLIIRNSIPNVSYLLSSYIYIIFEKKPYWLSYFSIIDGIITTIACYTYSMVFNNNHSSHNYYNKYYSMKFIIIGTTLLASIVSFMNIPYVHMISNTINVDNNTNQEDHDDSIHININKIIFWTILLNALSSVTSEWKFMPDVVLATITSITNNENVSANNDECNEEVHYHSQQQVTSHEINEIGIVTDQERAIINNRSTISNHNNSHHQIADSSPTLKSQAQQEQHQQESLLKSGCDMSVNANDDGDVIQETPNQVHFGEVNRNTNANDDDDDINNVDNEMMGIQYSSFLSCIDYGDQLNSIILGQLILWLGTSRENNWEHLDILICICSIAMFIPLFFLYLIK